MTAACSSWSGKVLVGVANSGGALAAAVLSLFLIPILTFYLLRDWDVIMAHIGALIPESQRATVGQLAHDADDVLAAFLRGQILVMLFLAIIYSVGLTISGVQFAVAIGVVSGLVSFVPYLGLVFGIGLATLVVALMAVGADPPPAAWVRVAAVTGGADQVMDAVRQRRIAAERCQKVVQQEEGVLRIPAIGIAHEVVG